MMPPQTRYDEPKKQERPTAKPCCEPLPCWPAGILRAMRTAWRAAPDLLLLGGAMMRGDCVVEILARSELDTLAGRNVDLLTRLRVDTNAGGGVFHREHTEPDQADGFALF